MLFNFAIREGVLAEGAHMALPCNLYRRPGHETD
jgi:hypothetical protein